MDTAEVKKQMMKLWKSTFHDSDEYISLIFDNYFDGGLIEYEEIDGIIVSALLGIPYEFSSNELDCSKEYASENLKTQGSVSNLNREGLVNIFESKKMKTDISDTEIQYGSSENGSFCTNDIKNFKTNRKRENYNKFPAINGKNFKLHGLYLCGLATHPEYRDSGIMSHLIEKINRRARELNFDFTFLIPANDGLVKYYYDRDYVNAFYRIINRYLVGHNFKNELLNNARTAINRARNINTGCERSNFVEYQCEKPGSIQTKKVRFVDNNEPEESYFNAIVNAVSDYNDSVKIELLNRSNQEIIDKLKDFISRFEKSQNAMTLCHSRNDIDIIISENLISRGDILVASTKDGTICGVAFIAGLVNDEIDIRQIMAVDECVRLKLLSAISSKMSHKFPAATALRVYRRPSEAHRLALWRPVFGATDPTTPIVGAFGQIFSSYAEADFPEVYGMIRLLKCDNVLKFLGSRQDSEIKSILVDGLQTGIVVEFETNSGFYRVFSNENSQNDEIVDEKTSESYTDITLKQFAEIIFRRPKSPKIVSEAFGIPNLPIDMSLMLD